MKNNLILECMYAFCIGHLFVTWIFLTDSLKRFCSLESFVHESDHSCNSASLLLRAAREDDKKERFIFHLLFCYYFVMPKLSL